ncbi:TIGR04141 family sporadically distributed protein [Mucilaginibacter celer]|uniref:Sporadically distributed protein, TIGR04141 family n=1 Tax=Mucilaginibacter celer TaxID=2305508 RepID=A0A494VK15_9SPHI|nr:TIGR04141 family sporadically distributed protein [Mucilaginibacter celer]AYL94249.1 hypothetical protein HYN43_002595 [Mucilaginibacter celer]
MAKRSEEVSNKLKLYLIKDEYNEFDTVVKDPSSPGLHRAVIPGVGTLYYKDSYAQTPAWIGDFFCNHEAINPSAFKVANTQAVLLVKLKAGKTDRIFGIPFGMGRHLMKELAVESRFGLITTLNVIEASAIRSVGKRTISSNPKISIEQISRASGTDDFQINIERDLIESIAGASAYQDFGKVISGKDALSVTAKADVRNIGDFLKKVFDIYNKKDYTKEFKWIDQIREVKDQQILSILNGLLISGLNGTTRVDAWLAIPEIIDWADFNGFKYSARKKDDLIEDLDIEDYLAEKAGTPVTIEQLENDVISCWKESKNNYNHSWSVFQCLNAEVRYNKELYFLDKGKWYRIESSFVKQVEEETRSVKHYPKKLPDFVHQDENDYNNHLARTLNALCLDAKTIQYGGGASKIEVCDVLSDDAVFFHVKKYGGSANLSHLFAQGYVSGELFITDEGFREAVRKKFSLKAPYDLLFPKQRPTASEYSIVFGIITTSTKPLNLPFFSKVTLRSYKRILEAFGFNIYLAQIRNCKPKTRKAALKK